MRDRKPSLTWWDFHGCKTAAERVACLTPRITRALDGASGSMPLNCRNGLDTPNRCTAPAKLVRPRLWNLLAIRVYDAGGAGGFGDDAPVLSLANEAIVLKGVREFRTGDAPPWANWPPGSGPPRVARFQKLIHARPRK